jgi:hypothetical protein
MMKKDVAIEKDNANKKKGVDKKGAILSIFFAAILLVVLINSIPSAGAASICCEKTLKGAVCSDTTTDNCPANAMQAETSCSQTSFCRLGTCIDNNAGECKPNTAKKACDDIQGYWDSRAADEIPQCKLGCCYLGGQTTFVTSTQCKTQSAMLGVEKVFDSSITNSLECIASGVSEDKGACVYSEEGEFGNACKLTTEKDCRKIETNLPDSNAEFYKGFLCTAEELNTNCAPNPQAKATICSNELVYFTDTCGNTANVYDASKYNDESYWTKIIAPEDSCGFGQSNSNSASCGNCNYNLGSTCSDVKRGETGTATYGDYICRDLSCKYDTNSDGKMETYQHGEKWCAMTPGTSAINSNKKNAPDPFTENVPGSEYTLLSCYNGKVIPEQCGDGARNQICIENTIYPDGVTPFRNAKCSANLWQDCITIDNKKDCEDIEKRDCKWVPTLSRTDDDRLTTWKPSQQGDFAPLIKTDTSLPIGRGIGYDMNAINTVKDLIGSYFGAKVDLSQYASVSQNIISFQNGACVPRYAPGFDFMGTASGGTQEQMKNLSDEAASTCALANAVCIIKKTKTIGGTWTSVENSECEPDPSGPDLWFESMKNICVSLGDCGATVNYADENGDTQWKDALTRG